jgi:hypothetical protein
VSFVEEMVERLYMVLLFQNAAYGGQDLAIKIAIRYPKYSDLKIN